MIGAGVCSFLAYMAGTAKKHGPDESRAEAKFWGVAWVAAFGLVVLEVI